MERPKAESASPEWVYSDLNCMNMNIIADERIMKALIPVVMAGILSVYGLVVSVLIIGNVNAVKYLYSD
jgi:ATP synthase proteolipid subunit